MKRYTGGVRHDYKDDSGSPTGVRGRRWLLFTFGLSLPLLTVALLYASQSERSKAAPLSSEVTVGPIKDLPLALAPVAPPAVEPASPIVIEPLAATLDLLVKRGDTLEILFRRNGLSLADLAQLVALPEGGAGLKLLKPGDRLAIAHLDGQIVSLRRELDDVKVLSIAREGTGFAATTFERRIDVRTSGAHAVIDSSLFEAGMAAGMSDRITMDMAGIFEWDIDFIQDVREGDQFTVIYEEIWRDGVKLRNGAIVAAEFVNQGKPFRAARYKDASGHSDYYTPEGRSLRKAFIRAPLNFTRISSTSIRADAIRCSTRFVRIAASTTQPPRARRFAQRATARCCSVESRAATATRSSCNTAATSRALRPHVEVRHRPRRRAREARRRDRIRREVRPRDGTAPALRVPCERRAPQSAHGLSATGRSRARRV